MTWFYNWIYFILKLNIFSIESIEYIKDKYKSLSYHKYQFRSRGEGRGKVFSLSLMLLINIILENDFPAFN